MEHTYRKAVHVEITSDDVKNTKNKIRKLRNEALELRNATADRLKAIRCEVISATAWLKRHENKIKENTPHDLGAANAIIKDESHGNWDSPG